MGQSYHDKQRITGTFNYECLFYPSFLLSRQVCVRHPVILFAIWRYIVDIFDTLTGLFFSLGNKVTYSTRWKPETSMMLPFLICSKTFKALGGFACHFHCIYYVFVFQRTLKLIHIQNADYTGLGCEFSNVTTITLYCCVIACLHTSWLHYEMTGFIR